MPRPQIPPTRQAILTQLSIHPHDRDLRTLTGPELLALFGSPRSGKLVTTRLIRNLAYQAWQRIRSGDEPPIKGNVRSFWYRFVKPAVMRVPARDRNCGNPDEMTSAVLADLIEHRRLFDYEDFGFTDENWRNRAIGLRRPHVLAFAEKTAHVRLLARLRRRLGVSFVALGGAPSACTSEYTAKQLLAALPADEDGKHSEVHLVGLVDYDPSGALIARAFVEQLASFGLDVSSVQLVVGPRAYTESALQLAALPLRDGPRTRRWLSDGGGIAGEALGLSVESLPDKRLESLMAAAIRRVAPNPKHVTLPGGERIARAEADNALVIRADDLGPAVLSEVADGRTVLIVEDGAVVAVLGR